jgi:hypothetical protein
MVNKLFKAGAENLAQWGIEIEAEPINVNSRKLAVPMLDHKSGSDDLFCSERLLKQMPVYNSKSLENRKVFLMHDQKLYNDDVSKIMRELTNCQNQLGMNAKKIVPVPFKYPSHADKYAN